MRFFISTPRRVPIVAIIKVSRTSVSCVAKFPLLSIEMILFIGHGAEDIEAEDEEDDDTEHNYDKFMVMLQ